MEKIKGIVEEIYIPIKENEDVMNSNKIGFKIKTDKEIITIEEEQNEENTKIFREDEVIIIKQIISGIEFVDIKKLEGEDYE